MTQNDITTDKLELIELANKLFMFCDSRQWKRLQEEVFLPTVLFDMTSAGGGEVATLPASEICDLWRIGFTALDAVHHQAGHYLVTVQGNNADIYAYAVALHYKKGASKGNTRSFTGSYDLKAEKTNRGWRLSQFKYNLKFIDGNVDME